MSISINGGSSGYAISGLNKSLNGINKGINQLSTGLRINNAADDAAGLAISEGLIGQIRGYDAASSNLQSGISLSRVAEGGLSNISEDLLRIRELTIQAGNGSYTDDERKALQDEANQLLQGINDISSRTEFNTKKILDGSQAANVSVDQNGVKAFVKGAVQSGSYQGTVNSRTGADGQIIRELVLTGSDGSTTTSTLSDNFRASNALSNVDVQLDPLTSAKTTAGAATETEKVLTFGGAATATYTDSAANTVAVNFAAGNITTADLVSQLNTSFTGAGVNLVASLSSDGDLVVQGNAGQDYTVTGSNAEYQSALGVTDGVIAAPSASESASFEGQFNQGQISDGIEFASAVTFDVGDGTSSAASISVGGAGVTLTKSQITDLINTQLSSAGVDVSASFDSDNKLQFESLAVGNSARVTVSDTSAGADTLSSVFNVNDGGAQGNGTTSFNLNVSSTGLSFQSGANQGQISSFAIGNFSAESLGVSGIDFSTEEGRNAALGSIDDALSQVSSGRSSLGATENAYTSAFNNLSTTRINLSSANSQIRDVDVAAALVDAVRFQALLDTGKASFTQSIQQFSKIAGLIQGASR